MKGSNFTRNPKINCKTLPSLQSCGIFLSNLFAYSVAFDNVQWNPHFSNLQGKQKLVQEIRKFEKSRVKMQCLTKEGKQLLVRAIGSFEKSRAREIVIPL